MKAFLLATALIAAPAIAQSSTMQPPAETTTTTDTTTTDTTSTDTMQTDTAPGQPAPRQPAPGQPAPATDATMNVDMGARGQAMQAPTSPPAGAPNVVFQQPQSVDQAFPAPAPKASYPVCSRTVTDACKQRVDPKQDLPPRRNERA